jgi:hypothetical protein
MAATDRSLPVDNRQNPTRYAVWTSSKTAIHGNQTGGMIANSRRQKRSRKGAISGA